jgi:hypothetical protein
MSESRMQDTLKVFADHGRPLAPERIPEFRKAWNRLTPAIQERAFRDVSSKAGRLWKGSAFTPAPLKYLKDRGWEDPYVDKAAAAQSGNAAMARVREKYLGAEKG